MKQRTTFYTCRTCGKPIYFTPAGWTHYYPDFQHPIDVHYSVLTLDELAPATTATEIFAPNFHECSVLALAVLAVVCDIVAFTHPSPHALWAVVVAALLFLVAWRTLKV